VTVANEATRQMCSNDCEPDRQKKREIGFRRATEDETKAARSLLDLGASCLIEERSSRMGLSVGLCRC
jgi:hypothetical protein